VVQTPDAIWRLGLITFVIGALLCLASLVAIRFYPITRARLAKLHAEQRKFGL
jgi:Na+/melibiose symporter-like transporter